MSWEQFFRRFPQRLVVSTMVLLAVTIQYLNRWSLKRAMRVVTDKGYHVHTRHSTDCVFNDTDDSRPHPIPEAVFYWTAKEQSDLLSVFYLGYMITHVPGGWLSDRYGPKEVMGFGTLVSGVCVYLTPLCARITDTPWVLMINRVVMGLAQGPTFPCMSSFIARWSLPSERHMMAAYMTLGIWLGAMGTMLVTGALLTSFATWDRVFYIYGVLTVLFTGVWQLLVHDTPSMHPFITDTECDKINNALVDEKHDSGVKIPVINILKSVPVWAMIIVNLGQDCNFYMLDILIPQYLDYYLYINVSVDLITSCVPYLFMLIFSISSAMIADVVLKRRWLTKTRQCKVWAVICNVLPALFILLTEFSGCNRTIAVSCYILALAFIGVSAASIWVVNVDLAPNHAGLLMGLLNGFGNVLGIIYPKLVSIYKEKEVIEGWRIVFVVNFAVVCLATLVFVFYGSSELQPWNKPTRPSSPDGTTVQTI